MLKERKSEWRIGERSEGVSVILVEIVEKVGIVILQMDWCKQNGGGMEEGESERRR